MEKKKKPTRKPEKKPMKPKGKKPAAKSVARTPSKKPTEKVNQVKEAYRKSIELIVKVNELMVDGMDDRTIDELLDQVAAQRKILAGTKKNEVVGRLLKSLTGASVVEIDEAADTD